MSDGRGALFFSTANNIARGGAQNSERIDAAVLVEAFVLGGQDGLLEDFRRVLDAQEGTALLAEFADQVTVCGIDAQRNLGAVIGQDVERREVRVDQRQCNEHESDRHGGQPSDDHDREKNPAGQIWHGI